MRPFEIIKLAEREHYGTLTAPAAVAALIGTAYQEGATAGQAVLADGSSPIIGFVTRDIVVGGPTLADSIMPGRTALPFQDGRVISTEYAQEYEAEGVDYLITSGPGALTSGTALKTAVSFSGGKTCKAVSGQIAEFILVDKPTPLVGGALRMRFRRLPAPLIP